MRRSFGTFGDNAYELKGRRLALSRRFVGRAAADPFGAAVIDRRADGHAVTEENFVAAAIDRRVDGLAATQDKIVAAVVRRVDDRGPPRRRWPKYAASQLYRRSSNCGWFLLVPKALIVSICHRGVPNLTGVVDDG